MEKEIQIIAYKCTKCGKLHYPYHDRCLNCRNRDFDLVKPEGNARVITFTRIYNLPWGFDQRYLTIGVIEFENGVRAMGQIDVDEKFDIKLGQEMKPTWAPVRKQADENVYGLVLESLG